MSEKKYYCFCGSNCKYETMTKEQILAAITQMVETGSVGDVDTGFITKIKEQNGGKCVTFWVGTQAQYNAIEDKELNCMYIITDDTTKADMEKLVKELQAALEEAQKLGSIASSIEGEYAHIDTDAAATGYPNFAMVRKYSTGIAEAEIVTKIANIPFTTAMNGFYAATHPTAGNWMRMKWESLTEDDENFAALFNPNTLFKCDISCSTLKCVDSDGSVLDVGAFMMCKGNFSETYTQHFAILATENSTATAYLRISLAWRWKEA